MCEIKFGTSGWRAIIGKEFTFENVRLVTQAIADYINSRTPAAAGHSSPRVVIGYDTRFLSDDFAKEAAKVISANGIRVLLSGRDIPTPVVSYHLIKNRCSGGINFTASHNPPQYNGIKFSSNTGGPASLEITKAIEVNILKLQHQKNKPFLFNNESGRIKIFDARPAYLKQIKSLIDFKTIRKAKLKIAVDCLYGTSRGYLDLLLEEGNRDILVLHNYLNPSFDGRRPEPSAENIEKLVSMVKKKRLDLGLATDGDADRFGIIDSNGTYITANQVISLVFYHQIKNRHTKAKTVARSIATTHMIDAIALRHNIDIKETPVGFKYFVDIINKGDCVIAGEESGGLSISGHLPEKDGILACLLIAELVAISRQPLCDILKKLYKTYGEFYNERIDTVLSEAQKKTLLKRLNSGAVGELAGLKVLRTDLRDGCKLYLEDGSWALFRPSGTEPIVRSYFESRSQKKLYKLTKTWQKMIEADKLIEK